MLLRRAWRAALRDAPAIGRTQPLPAACRPIHLLRAQRSRSLLSRDCTHRTDRRLGSTLCRLSKSLACSMLLELMHRHSRVRSNFF